MNGLHRYKLHQVPRRTNCPLPIHSTPARTYFVYSPDWDKRARLTRQLLPRCTRNPTHRAQCVHHMRYRVSWPRAVLYWLKSRKWSRSVAAREIPGWDIVPLCVACHGGGPNVKHGTVHQVTGKNISWVREVETDQNYDYQVTGVLWSLRVKFWLFVVLYRIWPVIAIALIAPFVYGGYLLNHKNQCTSSDATTTTTYKGKSTSFRPGKSGSADRAIHKTLLRRGN